MAGKKKTSATTETKGEKTLAEKLAALDDICKGAVENGLAVAGRLSDPNISEFLTIKWIPTPSDDVNELLGGGVPRGKVTIISGAPDVGKTKLAEQTIAEGMKNDPNFVAVWMEAENSMNKKSMIEDGIDPNRLHFFSQNKQAAAEGIADTLFAILSADIKPDVVVINSLKMLVPKNEMTKSMEKVSVAEQARFNARLMNRIVPMLAENNTALIIIQHLTTNIGQMFGNPEMLAGGRAIRHAAHIQLKLSRISIQESDPIKKDEGVKIKALCEKNHCEDNRYCYGSVEYYAIFGEGVEQIFSTMKRLLDKGELIQRGAWIYRLDDNGDKMEEWSWQGKGAFREDMKAHPEKLAELKDLIKGECVIQSISSEEIAEIEREEQAAEELLKEIEDN